MNTSSHAAHGRPSLRSVALRATLHCLAGCAIGEVLGMVLGTTFGWSNGTTVAASVALAFTTGFLFTMQPLLAAGFGLSRALGLAFASDTASIALMEVVDNSLMLVIPGAMDATLTSGLFWSSMAASLVLAGAAAFPLNAWLISRGQGHAVVHAHHAGDGGEGAADAHAGHHAQHRM